MTRKTAVEPSAYILSLCREELLAQTAHDVRLLVEIVCQYPHTEEIGDLLFSCLALYNDPGLREHILRYLETALPAPAPRLSEAALTCLADVRNTAEDGQLAITCTGILLREDAKIVLARIEGMMSESDKPSRRMALHRTYVSLLLTTEDLLNEYLPVLTEDLLALAFSSPMLFSWRSTDAAQRPAYRALLARGVQSNNPMTRSQALRMALESNNLHTLPLPSG